MPPYNEEAEQAVLAGLFHYEKYQDDIFSSLQPDDFYVPRHSIIFQACYELFQQRAPIAPQSLSEKLHSQGKLEEAGGMEYISTVYAGEVMGVNALFYMNMVRSKAMQRRLINTCASIMSSTFDTPYDRVDGLLDDAEHSIFTIAERSANTNDLRSVRDLRDAFFNKLERNAQNPGSLTGVTTGFADLDRMTGGLQASDLIIVAARPSMGKTAFALNLAINAADA
ncbi:MAG: DnaB-like helicase N-terminal domain-containing protein, partial [Desulfovibrionaceae bacterium]|nr:DnaB-like helicase N-terminal domain-containing protein [Desulfovibrionaceae bacterium]